MNEKTIADAVRKKIAEIPETELRLICFIQICQGSGFRPGNCVTPEEAKQGHELMLSIIQIVRDEQAKQN